MQTIVGYCPHCGEPINIGDLSPGTTGKLPELADNAMTGAVMTQVVSPPVPPCTVRDGVRRDRRVDFHIAMERVVPAGVRAFLREVAGVCAKYGVVCQEFEAGPERFASEWLPDELNGDPDTKVFYLALSFVCPFDSKAKVALGNVSRKELESLYHTADAGMLV